MSPAHPPIPGHLGMSPWRRRRAALLRRTRAPQVVVGELLQRMLDLGVAAFLLVLLLPVVLVRGLVSRHQAGAVFVPGACRGRPDGCLRTAWNGPFGCCRSPVGPGGAI